MQNKVKSFNDYVKTVAHRKPMEVEARMLDVVSESGELAKEVLKSTKYGTQKFVVTDDFKLEFGDVLYSLFSLAGEIGVDSNECLDMVISKYKTRIDESGNMGSEGNNN